MSEEDRSERIRAGDFYLAPESESTARAAAALPTEGSEDASHILAPLGVSESVEDEPDEYLPCAGSEWIVDVDFDPPGELHARQVASLFDEDWQKTFGGPTIFGRDALTGKWTFLISADGPDQVTELKFAWPYYATWPAPHVASITEFEERIAAVERQLSTIAAVNVSTTIPPDRAHQRSEELSTLSERFDRQVVLQLRAPSGQRFSGKEVWDVMLSLGLTWGDMDCFHWMNPTGVGDENHFSVETSTPPGYFLPEEIAAGRVQVEDLVFIFSIPRCADPVKVFERMHAAVKYAQGRLGGEIVDDNGQEIDYDATRREIQELASELKSLGFPPGSDGALQFF